MWLDQSFLLAFPSYASLAPASKTAKIIHCILEWVNLIFTRLKNVVRKGL